MSQADSINTTNASGVGGEALYLPTDVTPEEIFVAIGKLRKEAQAEIDRLIHFLDKTDNYMWRELEDDGDLEPEELEPSLGFLDHMVNQTRISEGYFQAEIDAEDEHDGREPDEDGEPSLGSLEQQVCQDFSWQTGDPHSVYREADPAESGIADNDGLQEQIGRQDWQPGVFG